MEKNKRWWTLRTKITGLSLIIVLTSVMIVSTFIGRSMEENLQREIESNVMNVAKMTANNPIVRDAFFREEPSEIIDPLMKDMRGAIEGVEFIVVTNLQGIRYSHPNPDRVNQRFVGGDEQRALEEGEEYISIAEGTLGVSTRAFTNVYDEEGNRIGMVTAGILNENIEGAMEEMRSQIQYHTVVAMFIGALGSVLLAGNLKKSLMGLEPHEISKIYKEKNIMLETIREGIIAIDEEGKISIFNQSARRMFNIDKEKLEGLPITEVLPQTKMLGVLEKGEPEFDREYMVGDTSILVNRIPIEDEDKIIGVISSFRDKTELVNLGEELTGAKMLVDSLRANTHEFKNKMHVLLGLLHLKDYEMAEEYILETTEKHEDTSGFILKTIKDPGVAAILIGKYSTGKELGIDFSIKGDSKLDNEQQKIPTSALITIVGNLLENAFDAVKDLEGKKNVIFYASEDEGCIELGVKDNGIGIPKEERDKIYDRSYSSKGKSRGVGLSLIHYYVESLSGEIILNSEVGVGTDFRIRLPKGKERSFL